MGRQKKGNANAQRNNNAKKQGKKNNKNNEPEFGSEDDPGRELSYAEIEVEKMNRNNK